MKLHITNGDCAGDLIRAAQSIAGEVLCWRDLLHDGPVQHLPYTDYVAGRSDYLISLLATEREVAEPVALTKHQIQDDFWQRQQVLENLAAYDEIVLWFEHDLYDQLQLLEIAHRLLQQVANLPPLSIICINHHPQVACFHGLGDLSVAMLESLYPERQPLTTKDLHCVDQIWQALVAPEPQRLAEYAATEVPGWPFMAAALRRFCLEYPALETGLTLTQTYLLMTLLKGPDELPALEQRLQWAEQQGRLPDGVTAEQRYYDILSGPATFRRIFNHLQQLEIAPFMGDLSVASELHRLCTAAQPYMQCSGSGPDAVYQLTRSGAEALQGRRQWHQDNALDLWRGGVHITAQHLWFWDQSKQQFVAG